MRAVLEAVTAAASTRPPASYNVMFGNDFVIPDVCSAIISRHTRYMRAVLEAVTAAASTRHPADTLQSPHATHGTCVQF